MTEPTIKETYSALGLSDFEYDRILELMGRAPNYLELSLFSVMWSEHCGYKNSRPLLRRFPNTGPRVLQGPGENAGVVEVGDGWAVAFKMESHNHPSAVEPYEGAATGAGGIIRDILAMGARPVALLDSLRFGPTEGDSPEASRNRYLLREVVRGIGGYGNAVGVPTVGGEVVFDPSYSGNPLVNAMCVGLIRIEDIVTAQATGEGNLVVLIGSKTGRDGIHGATFASDELSEESESKRSNVQVGDPFTEKMVIECCLKALSEGLFVSLQDLGAAGITSSASEMAAKGGVGIEIETDKVPLRESGMEPWEVMISESQERMLAVVEPGKRDEVLALTERYGLVGAVVGRVTDHGELRVIHDGEIQGGVPAQHLADAPTYEREAVRPKYLDDLPKVNLNQIPEPDDYNEVLLKLLASPNIRSKHSVYEQYDHEVQTNTVVRPGADAAVIRIKGSRRGFAVTTDGRGRHCYLDPRGGGIATVVEAYRNLSCVGAEPVAVTDCLNFGNPEKPDGYYQLAECIEGISIACEALGTPVVSGNVSLYNETERGAIHPTPIVGMVGVMDDVSRHATPAFKREGDRIVFVGGAEGKPRHISSLAGSEYLAVMHGELGRAPARMDDLKHEKRAGGFIRHLIRTGVIDTAHDVSAGGDVVALAEMAMLGGIGLYFDSSNVPDLRSGYTKEMLFGEGVGGYLITVEEDRWEELQVLLGGGTEFGSFGYEDFATTGGDRFTIGESLTFEEDFTIEGIVDLPLSEMKEVYERDLFG